MTDTATPSPNALRYGTAIQAAVQATTTEIEDAGGVVYIDDVLAALLGVVAAFIGGVDDEAGRQYLFEMCGVSLANGIAQARATPNGTIPIQIIPPAEQRQ